MDVHVRYFAAAAEAAGRDEESIAFTEGATIGDLAHLLTQRYGDAMERVLRVGSFLLDGVVHRDHGAELTVGVDILPPFAGG